MTRHHIDVEIHMEMAEEDHVVIEWLQKAITHAMEMEALPVSEVSVVIVGDEEMMRWNKEYRGIERTTDVLSFPLWEDIKEWDPRTGSLPLGDIIISLEKAKEQAIEYGHTLSREVSFLAVHGFLHLVGYLHDTVESEKRMFSRQEQILHEIGLMR